MRSYMALSALCLAGGPVQAGELLALQGGGIDLGSFHGVVYYTSASDGYEVVTTIAEGEGLPVRFVATLAAGQTLTISVPGKFGEPGKAVEISRSGDMASSRISPPPTRWSQLGRKPRASDRIGRPLRLGAGARFSTADRKRIA